jgi:hypothetical protein
MHKSIHNTVQARKLERARMDHFAERRHLAERTYEELYYRYLQVVRDYPGDHFREKPSIATVAKAHGIPANTLTQLLWMRIRAWEHDFSSVKI